MTTTAPRNLGHGPKTSSLPAGPWGVKARCCGETFEETGNNLSATPNPANSGKCATPKANIEGYIWRRGTDRIMPLWIVGIIAAIAGIIVGYLARTASASTQKALLEQSNRDLTDALNSSRAESAQRSGEILELTRQNSKFESDLANEKANAERLTQQFKLLSAEILKENSKTFS